MAAPAQQVENQLNEALFRRKGVPPIKDLIPTSLQHVLASFAGVITPAMIIATMCNFTEAQETAIIQVALILSAIDTLLQQFPLFGRIGSGLPILTGVSFAFLPAFQAVGIEFGFSTLLGAELIGGAVAVLFGIFYTKVRSLFPPLVTGTVIFTIGVSLYPTAITYMAGGSGAADFGGVQNWIVGLITFAVVFALSNFATGVFKLGSIFFGIIIGVLVSIPFGMVSAEEVAGAAWFSLPELFPFEIVFNPAACITLAMVYVMVNVQLIGDLSASCAGSMDRMPTEREIGGAIKAQGIVSMISSVLGGMPTSAFGQNVGIIVSNKVINRWVFGAAAIVFLAAGLCPKLSAIPKRHPHPGEGRPHAARLHRLWHLRGLWHWHRAGVRLAHRPWHAGLAGHDLRHLRHHALCRHGDYPELHPPARQRGRAGEEEPAPHRGGRGRRGRRGGRGRVGARCAARGAGCAVPLLD